jgi:hypothetical protein
MGLLSRLLNGPERKNPLEVHKELAPIYAACAQKDGRQAQAAFAATRGRWDLHTHVVELAAERYLQKLDRSVRQSTADTLVKQGEVGWLLARGIWHCLEGWEARGSGSGDTVSEEGGRELERRCELGQQDLREAARLEPQNPAAYTLLIRVGKGLSDRDLGERAYAEAIARDPGGYEPRIRYLGLISERWFGSFDEMLSHARQVAEQAPEGADNASLPIEAHYDRYSHARYFEEDDDVEAARRYLVSAAVQDEVARTLARSVDNPKHQPSTATLRIRHTAAALYWQAGKREAARDQLEKVGETFYKTPWDPGEPFPGRFYGSVRKQLGLR